MIPYKKKTYNLYEKSKSIFGLINKSLKTETRFSVQTYSNFLLTKYFSIN